MDQINVGLIGYNFMGRAHSNAYRQVPFYFPELEAKPVMKALCGRTKERVDACAEQFGWESVEYDVDDLLARDDIDLVDITVPNNMHAELAVKAAEAGKHVFCEKPLATTVEDAEKMVEAVSKAGCVNMLCHNYRRAPAISLAKQMIENGDLGEIYHWRSLYLQDWLMAPEIPMMWRVQKEIAGSGSLGDLMAHSIDLALWLLGDIESLSCTMETFITERPIMESFDTGWGGKAKEDGQMGTVDVDDGVIALCRFANGAIGTMEATRYAAGHKNYNWFEVNGSRGSIVFNLERMNELEYYDCDDPGDRQGFRLIQATADCHPFMGLPEGAGPRFWPVAHIIGYEHTFINTVFGLCQAVATGEQTWPSFADGLRTQRVLAACDQAADSGKWEDVE